MPAIASATSAAGGASGGTRATSSRCDALSMLHSGCNLARAVHRFSRRRRCFYRQKHRRSTRTLHWQSQWRPIHSLLSSATPPRLLRGWDALPMFHSGCNLARAVHRFSRRRRCFYRQKHRRSTRTLHWQSQWHPIHALLSSATPPPNSFSFVQCHPAAVAASTDKKHRRSTRTLHWQSQWHPIHALLSSATPPMVACNGSADKAATATTPKKHIAVSWVLLSLSPCSVCPVRRLCFSITASPLTL